MMMIMMMNEIYCLVGDYLQTSSAPIPVSVKSCTIFLLKIPM